MIPPGKSRHPHELRKTHRLTAEELAALDALPPDRWSKDTGEGGAFRFWGKVAAARGLDYRSILGNPYDRAQFTALPMGHGKHWCWPMPLKCQKPPPEFAATYTQYGFGVPA